MRNKRRSTCCGQSQSSCSSSPACRRRALSRALARHVPPYLLRRIHRSLLPSPPRPFRLQLPPARCLLLLPSSTPTITVTGLEFNFTSSPRVDVPDPDPSWLDYVTGYISTEEAITNELQTHVASAIQGSPLAGQVQTILNQVLSGSPAMVA